jgi:ribosomal protein S3
VSRIIIERPHKKCRITIYAARPGVIIGKKGADIDKLRKDIAAMTEGEVHLNIVEIRKPETDAQLVAENIASAARAPRGLPPRHEALDAVGHAAWRQGRPDQRFGPPRRR